MTDADPKTLEAAALAVLTGTPAAEVAARLSLPPDVVCSAAQVYQAAGYGALQDQVSHDGWHQVRIDFSDWEKAEHIGVSRLGLALAQAAKDGRLTRWFFTRKVASWRLRCQAQAGEAAARREGMTELLARTLNTMAERSEITGWQASIYEMETHAFGGSAGMELAHELFHTDSVAILGHLADSDTQSRLHRRRNELSILLGSTLLRCGGLDWYEQGDVWARVAAHRNAIPDVELDQARTRTALRRLMTADTGPASSLVTSGRLMPHREWVTGFERAGRTLRCLAENGVLERGLRAILAHHILFHWNRLGLATHVQGTLAALARDVVMEDRGRRRVRPQAALARPKLLRMETGRDATMTTSESPEHLRNSLIDKLVARGAVRSAEVEAAMRLVPRHRFLPEVSIAEAYADTQVVTKTDVNGKALSSVSHPGVVAGMLEQLDVRPGHRVLEIGSGGYNAALLTHLVGPGGQVTTLDIDPEVTARAQRCLAEGGYDQVRVITGDGEYGHQERAPYDRIIVTAGAWDLPPAWFDQLASDGLLVVPLRLRALSRIITFAPDNETWRSQAIEFAGFVPMRGDGAYLAEVVPLTDDGDVLLHTDDPADPAALGLALDQPAAEVWTGVTILHGTSYEHLDLWLAGTPGFSRLTATPQAIASGVVTPTFGWGGSAIHEGGSLAYLTEREIDQQVDADGKKRGLAEIGVRAHGPDSAQLAAAVAERIAVFDREHRTQHQAVIEVRPLGDEIAPRGSVITKRHVRLILSWE